MYCYTFVTSINGSKSYTIYGTYYEGSLRLEIIQIFGLFHVT